MPQIRLGNNSSTYTLHKIMTAGLVVLSLYVMRISNGVSYTAEYTILNIIIFVLSLVILGSRDYQQYGQGNIWRELGSTLVSWFLFAGGLIFIGYFSSQLDIFPRDVMTAWLLLTPLAIFVFDIIFFDFILRYITAIHNPKKGGRAGLNNVSRKLIQAIEANPQYGMYFAAAFDDRASDRVRADLRDKLTGGLSELPEFVNRNKIRK